MLIDNQVSLKILIHCAKEVFDHLPLYGVSVAVWEGQGRTLELEKWGHLGTLHINL